MTLRHFTFCCFAFVLCTGCNFSANRHNVAGRQAFEAGQVAQAINQFQTALSLDPNNADAYHNLASAYYSMGKQSNNAQWLTQSEQLYRQAIGLNDQHVDAHRGLACLLCDTQRKDFAFDLLTVWQKRYPTASEPLVELARLNQENGNYQQATNLLADALRLDGQNTRVLKAMGHVRESQGQYAQAIQNYSRVLQLDNRQLDVAKRINDIEVRMAQAAQNQTR